jgi:hypothetical protein
MIEPAGAAVLLIHQQADLVAQLELIAGRLPAERADHVVAGDLAVQQVAAGQVGIVGHERAARRPGVGLGAFQENPPPVEAEVSVLKSEIAEARVQRTKHEVLNHFIIFGEEHLRHILDEWTTYYHTQRPHRGLGNVPISSLLPPPEPLESLRLEDVVCHESLGGLLKHYERRAA